MTRSRFGVFTCVFTCVCCRRVDQSGDSECCPQCWELAGIDNSVNDGAMTWAEARPECERLLAEIVERGGNGDRVRDDFEYLWPRGEDR